MCHACTYTCTFTHIVTFITPDVTIGFEFPGYSVDEDGGQVTVCAVVFDGGFRIPVTVRVNSRDGSATSTGTYVYEVVLIMMVQYVCIH